MADLERSGDELVVACRELRQEDPTLYTEILELTKAALASHRDPLGLRKRGLPMISLSRVRTRGSA